MVIAKIVSLIGALIIIIYWFAYFFLGYRVFKNKSSPPKAVLFLVLFTDLLLVLLNLGFYYFLVQSGAQGEQVQFAILISFVIATIPFILYLISKIFSKIFHRVDINKYF